MILQVMNAADYEQSITLHTGEAKSIDSGLSLRINTGSDKRLINYYVSLINYNFKVSIVSASDEEANNFNDSIQKFTRIKNQLENANKLQDTSIYPIDTKPVINDPHPTAISEKDYNPNPNVLPDNKIRRDNHRTFMDSHSGMPDTVDVSIPPESILSDFVEVEQPAKQVDNIVIDNPTKPTESVTTINNPEEIVEVQETEQEVPEVSEASNSEEVTNNDSNGLSFDEKYKLLDTLDEDVLRNILTEKFGEVSKARTKWKVAYRIIELADASNIDVTTFIK